METMTITVGVDAQNFNILYKVPFPVTEEERYTDINWNQVKKVIAYWSAFEVHFALLSEAQMDWLLALQKEESFTINFGAGNYTSVLDKIKVQVRGSVATFIIKAAET